MIRTTLLVIALFAVSSTRAQAQAQLQTPKSLVGTIGQRQPRQRVGDGVVATDRIAGRIQSRIQTRIRNRIDRNYVPSDGTASAVVAAQDQARTATPRTP